MANSKEEWPAERDEFEASVDVSHDKGSRRRGRLTAGKLVPGQQPKDPLSKVHLVEVRPNDRVEVEVGLSPRLSQGHVGLHLFRQRLGDGHDDTGRREDGRQSSIARSVDESGDDYEERKGGPISPVSCLAEIQRWRKGRTSVSALGVVDKGKAREHLDGRNVDLVCPERAKADLEVEGRGAVDFLGYAREQTVQARCKEDRKKVSKGASGIRGDISTHPT